MVPNGSFLLPILKKVVVFEFGSSLVMAERKSSKKIQTKKKERDKKVKRDKAKSDRNKWNEFVEKILVDCKVSNVDEVQRSAITRQHIEMLADYLSVDAGNLLARMFREADVRKEAIHLPANKEFFGAGFNKIIPSARILICRIIGSQGNREIEFTRNGIIVSPRVALRAQKKELQPA